MLSDPVFWLAALLALLGLAGIVSGIVSSRKRSRMLARARAARGTIVDHKRVKLGSGTGGRPYYYFPIVRYKTDAGEEVELLGARSVGNSTPSETVHWESKGREVDVVYDPESPKDAWLKGESTGSAGLIVFSLILLASGLGLAYMVWAQ